MMSELADYKFLGYQVNNISYDTRNIQNPTKQTRVENRIKVSVNPVEAQNGKARLECTVTAETVPENTDMKPEVIFTLMVVMIGRFAAPDATTEKEFAKFLNLNGVATLMPFLRASVAAITQAINLPQPIILPLFNVYNMPQNKE